jgi:ketosteroid isomerase-like protein
VPSGPPGPRPGDPDDVPETAGSVAVKRRSPLIPLLAVALIAVVAVVAMVVLRGDDDEAGASDPVALVRDYFDAFSSNDCDAAIDMIDSDGEPGEQDQDSMIDACRQAYEEERDSIEGARLVSADLVSQDGDRAVVRTQIVEGGQTEPSEPEDVAVIRIDGDWKIDLGGADQATDQTATTPTTAPASPDPTAPATTAPTP